jgi:hypothetical protein
MGGTKDLSGSRNNERHAMMTPAQQHCPPSAPEYSPGGKCLPAATKRDEMSLAMDQTAPAPLAAAAHRRA